MPQKLRQPLDVLRRAMRDLRISVTDRCNLRCTYCMPLAEYAWMDRNEVLRYEEIARLTRIFASLGAEEVRLTGGEPLLRKNLEILVRQIADIPQIKDISLTTNGLLLADQARPLKSAGLRRINVSLDSLNPEKFKKITQGGELSRVLAGIRAAQKAGLSPIKLNAVIIRNFNEDEIPALIDYARENELELRFIEYMDVGNANDWTREKLVPKKEILERVRKHVDVRSARRTAESDPAVVHSLAKGKGSIGVIASVTEPFCGSCTRARLTADGKLVTCLFSQSGTDLKALLRGGASDDDIRRSMQKVWLKRADRFSEERFAALSKNGYRKEDRTKIEMIQLGG